MPQRPTPPPRLPPRAANDQTPGPRPHSWSVRIIRKKGDLLGSWRWYVVTKGNRFYTDAPVNQQLELLDPLAERPPDCYRTICGRNWVDAADGYDTCAACLRAA